MNIYKQEIKFLTKNTIIWTITLCAILLFFFSMFPILVQEGKQYGESLKELLSNYDPKILMAIGASIEQFTSPTGFYAFCFMYITLCGAIQAMTIGVLVLSKEGARKTVDFIFTKPATRIKILTSKLCAAFTCILITNIVYISLACLTIFSIAKDFNVKVFLLISLTLFFIQVIFLSLGFLVAAVFKRIKSPSPVSLGVVLGFFVLSIIVNLTDDKTLKYISFFNYFKPNNIIQDNGYDLTFVICGIVTTLIFIATSFIYYNKKDIHSV